MNPTPFPAPSPPGDSSPHGIVCPVCRKPMEPIRTEKRVGRIQRRRRCVFCGLRVTTAERPVGPFTQPPSAN